MCALLLETRRHRRARPALLLFAQRWHEQGPPPLGARDSRGWQCRSFRGGPDGDRSRVRRSSSADHVRLVDHESGELRRGRVVPATREQLRVWLSEVETARLDGGGGGDDGVAVRGRGGGGCGRAGGAGRAGRDACAARSEAAGEDRSRRRALAARAARARRAAYVLDPARAPARVALPGAVAPDVGRRAARLVAARARAVVSSRHPGRR